MGLHRLRWAAILLPAGGVLAVELGLGFVLEPVLDATAVLLITTAVLIVGIVAFSPAIFRLIEAEERTILELYRRAQRSAERFERLIESSGDAIITVDLQGRILSWSRGASLTVKAGEPVRFMFANGDDEKHNLVGIGEGLNLLSPDVPGGQTVVYDWTAPNTSGKYTVICAYHPHMTFSLDVQ